MAVMPVMGGGGDDGGDRDGRRWEATTTMMVKGPFGGVGGEGWVSLDARDIP
jgi:hypothetical protein